MSRGDLGLLVAICLVLMAVGLGAHGMLEASSGPVRGFLAQGQRALAHGDQAQAALSFERARWLAPRATEVRAALTSLGTTDPEGSLTRLVRLLSSQEWSFLATGSAWLAALAGGLLVTGRAGSRTRALRGAALAALAAFVLSLGAVVQSNGSSPAIVTKLEVPLLVAPYGAAASESTLPAGTMVLTDRTFDTYIQVEGPGGLSGWVPRASLDPIAVSGG